MWLKFRESVTVHNSAGPHRMAARVAAGQGGDYAMARNELRKAAERLDRLLDDTTDLMRKDMGTHGG